MIDYLEGSLVSRGTAAVVAVGDGSLGLTLQLSSRAAEQLPAQGQPVRLWTHLVVREDSWDLYGFTTAEERSMFRLLIGVSGVGPKLALGVLSGASPAELSAYLRNGDERSLAKLPGIGPKSAARLVVELGQRIPVELAGTMNAPATPAAPGDTELKAAVAVLGAMGLTPVQAERALLVARAENAGVTENLQAWVRAALAHL